MQKTQIILSAMAIALIIALFLLPKVVLESDKNTAVNEEIHHEGDGHDHSPDEFSQNSAVAHNRKLTEEEENTIFRLRENYFNSKEKEKSATFADSLVAVYRSVALYDSAAKYSGFIADANPSDENFIKAGDNYFDAFSFSIEPERMAFYGDKARGYYSKVLDKKPGLLDVKNKVAMTYIASSNPMQGIMLLREVLEADPVNEQAMFNLGILSIQSRQYDKAIERLEKLIAIYPENLQARFYLGLSYFESGQKDKAKEQFLLVQKQDDDPAIQATVDNYLKEIK